MNEKIKKLLKEIEGYREMDLHDPNVISDLRGIKEDLNKEGHKITFEEIMDMLTDED